MNSMMTSFTDQVRTGCACATDSTDFCSDLLCLGFGLAAAATLLLSGLAFELDAFSGASICGEKFESSETRSLFTLGFGVLSLFFFFSLVSDLPSEAAVQ